MENENQLTVTENEAVQETAAATEIATEGKEIPLNEPLYVRRELAKDKYGKQIKTRSGVALYNYFLPCKIRGCDTRVDFITPDKGGFEVLDYVYNGGDKAELYIIPYSFGEGSNKQTGLKYEVRSNDGDGVVYKCDVKPARKSDASLLDTYLSILTHKAS